MGSRTRRALINTAIQGSGQIITWALSWVLLVLLPRALGDAGFGKLFFAISYCTLFSTLINLGVNTFLVREVAVLRPEASPAEADPGHRLSALADLLGNVLSLKIVLAVAVYLLQSLIILLLPYDPPTRQAVLIIGAGTCLGGIAQAMGGVFQGFERMLVPNLALIAEKAVITGGCALLLARGHGLLAVCWVHTAAAALHLALQLTWLQRIVRVRPAWDRRLLKRVFLGGLPFLIWVLFGEIYIRVDVVMLSLMTSDAVVGWYGAATRLYGTLLFIPNILTTAIFPAMMRLGADAAQEEGAFTRASERLMNLLLFAAVPVSFGTIAVASPLVARLYGPGPFHHAAANLHVLGFAILLVCVDVVLGTALIARGREKPWAGMAIAAACFNPLLNLWTIPLATRLWGNGGIGAALSTVLTEMLMMAGALWLMPPGIFSRRTLTTGLKGLALGLAMLVLLRALDTLPLIWLIAAGAAFYLPLAFLTGMIPREDIHHLLHALGRTRQSDPPTKARP